MTSEEPREVVLKWGDKPVTVPLVFYIQGEKKIIGTATVKVTGEVDAFIDETRGHDFGQSLSFFVEAGFVEEIALTLRSRPAMPAMGDWRNNQKKEG